MADSIYDFKTQDIQGQEHSLGEFKDKVMVIVNTASKCGYTPQYKGLQELYDAYKDQGLVVLGFPCDQFGHQEPGAEDEIQQFCQLNYGVSFPLFSKIDVNGPQTHPLYQFLKTEAPGLLGTKDIKWNFTKFLIDRHGQVVKRYAPTTEPGQMAEDIEAHLKV